MNGSKIEQEDWDAWVGKRVCAKGTLFGTLKFFGKTNFSSGLWCGIALDNPLGKNDGKVNNIRYFQCEPNFGIFVPHFKVTKLEECLSNEIIFENNCDKTFEIQNIHNNDVKNINLNTDLGVPNEWVNEAIDIAKAKLSNSRLDSEESLGILNPELIEELDASWNSLLLEEPVLDVFSDCGTKHTPDNEDCVFVHPMVPNFDVNIFSDTINPIYASTPRLNKKKIVKHQISKTFLAEDNEETNSTFEVSPKSTTDIIFDTNRLKNNPNLTSTSERPLDFSPFSDKVNLISSDSVEDVDLCESLNKTQTMMDKYITEIPQMNNFNATFQLSRISELNESEQSLKTENLFSVLNSSQCLKNLCFKEVSNPVQQKNTQLNSTFELTDLNKTAVINAQHVAQDPDGLETKNLEFNSNESYIVEPSKNFEINTTQTIDSKIDESCLVEHFNYLKINTTENLEAKHSYINENQDLQNLSSSNAERHKNQLNIQMNSTFDLDCSRSSILCTVDSQLNKTIDINNEADKQDSLKNNQDKDILLENTFLVSSPPDELNLDQNIVCENSENTEGKLSCKNTEPLKEVSLQNDSIKNVLHESVSNDGQKMKIVKNKYINSTSKVLDDIKKKSIPQKSRKSILPVGASLGNLSKADHVFKKPFSPNSLHKSKSNLVSYSARVKSESAIAHVQATNTKSTSNLNLETNVKKDTTTSIYSNKVSEKGNVIKSFPIVKAQTLLKAPSVQQSFNAFKHVKEEKHASNTSIHIKNKENLNNKEKKLTPKMFSQTLPASKTKCPVALKSIVAPSIQRSDSCKEFRETSSFNKPKLFKPFSNSNNALNTKLPSGNNQVTKPGIRDSLEPKIRRNSLSIMPPKDKLPVGIIKPRYSIVPSSIQMNGESKLSRSNSNTTFKVPAESKTISLGDSTKDKKISTRIIPTRKSMISGNLKSGLKPPSLKRT